jgi:hypothetical protein
MRSARSCAVSPTTTVLTPDDRVALAELAPVLRRAITLDPRGLARLRFAGESAGVLVRLPFGVLVSRTVESPARPEPLDLTARAVDLIAWLDAGQDDVPEPERRDLEWRTGVPPATGWHRIETVPDDVIRNLVRTGAAALKEAAAREGVPGAEPRAEVTDALLDSVVLTVSDDTGAQAEVTLRAVSALTRMGFVPRAGDVHVDIAGRWVRVVAEYGTVHLERPGQALGLA